MMSRRVVQTVLTKNEIEQLKNLSLNDLSSKYPSALIVSDLETIKALASSIGTTKKFPNN